MKTNWEIQAEIEKFFNHFREKLGLKELEINIYIENEIDGKSILGQAGVEEDGFFVRFSLYHLSREEEMIEEVTGHELAHIKDRQSWRNSPHGSKWQAIMTELGLPARATARIAGREPKPVWAR